MFKIGDKVIFQGSKKIINVPIGTEGIVKTVTSDKKYVHVKRQT